MSGNMYLKNLDKQAKLERLLNRLASEYSDDAMGYECYITELKEIYDGDFRHSYSQFFTIVTDLYNNANNQKASTSLLLENLTNIKQKVDEEYCDVADEHFRLSVDKLWDHMNLEISRYDIIQNTIDSFLPDRVNKIEDNTRTRCDTLENDIKQRVEGAEERISKIQSEFVAILGVFSAVVMAFSGSFTLLGGSFSQIAQAPLNKLMVITSIIGIVLFNTIFVLMYVISKMIGRNIYTHCKSMYCHECDENCNIINSLKKRFPDVFWFNVILLFIFIVGIFYNNVDCFIYFFRFITNLFLSVVTCIKTLVSCIFHYF